MGLSLPADPRRRPGRMLGGLLLLHGLVCGLNQATAATWTDALGRFVTAPAAPARIVSLAPSVTEILFALGAGERVVGVTTYCDYPDAARAKPKVGTYAEPSLEVVVSLAPDLVVAAADSAKPAFVARLEEARVPVYVVYPRSLRETMDSMRAIGQVVGLAAAGEQLALQLEQAIAAAQGGGGRAREHPSVLLCIMLQPLVVAGPGTLADDLIRAVGARNAVPAGPARFPTWGMESVLEADPDVILLATHGDAADPDTHFGRWPELGAVAGGRVRSLNADWIHRPGPRLTLGLEAMVRAVHGADSVRGGGH